MLRREWTMALWGLVLAVPIGLSWATPVRAQDSASQDDAWADTSEDDWYIWGDDEDNGADWIDADDWWEQGSWANDDYGNGYYGYDDYGYGDYYGWDASPYYDGDLVDDYGYYDDDYEWDIDDEEYDAWYGDSDGWLD